MSHLELDKVELEILNARAAAAISNPKDACFHLAQAIELLRKELTEDKAQPGNDVGYPPSLRYGPFETPLSVHGVKEMPNGYMVGAPASPITFTGQTISRAQRDWYEREKGKDPQDAWGTAVSLPDPAEQSAANIRALGMMNALAGSQAHNQKVRVEIDNLRHLCENLVKSERIVHPSYRDGVRGIGDSLRLQETRNMIDAAQIRLNGLEPHNKSIAEFNEKVARVCTDLLIRRDVAASARNSSRADHGAIEYERLIDRRLAKVTSFVATDWGEVRMPEVKPSLWTRLGNWFFMSRQFKGPNWYKQYTNWFGPK